jgi:hypothetical protein
MARYVDRKTILTLVSRLYVTLSDIVVNLIWGIPGHIFWRKFVIFV